MTLKDILIPTLDEPEDQNAIAAVEACGLFADAHVSALLLAGLPEPLVTAEGMAAVTIAEVIASVRESTKAATERLTQRAAARKWEVRVAEAWSRQIADTAVSHARHADLAVIALGKQGATSTARREMFESVLMDGGRAVLAIPAAWRAKAKLGRVLIAWDGGREAVRAVAEAAPFLAAADHIVVATVDAKPSTTGVGESPGADIATHLARHGLDIEIRNVDGMGREHGVAILSAAIDMDADLIVMGAYRHARLQQALFGGFTRTLLESSPIPMLLAH